jgi:hypothetical protein
MIDTNDINWFEQIDYINNLSENKQIELINKNRTYVIEFQSTPLIKHIKNPSEKVQIAAVRKYFEDIVWIENPTEETQMECIRSIHYYDSIDDSVVKGNITSLKALELYKKLKKQKWL